MQPLTSTNNRILYRNLTITNGMQNKIFGPNKTNLYNNLRILTVKAQNMFNTAKLSKNMKFAMSFYQFVLI